MPPRRDARLHLDPAYAMGAQVEGWPLWRHATRGERDPSRAKPWIINGGFGHVARLPADIDGSLCVCWGQLFSSRSRLHIFQFACKGRASGRVSQRRANAGRIV
jgi:hypothetical protein